MAWTPMPDGNQPQNPLVLICIDCQEEFVFSAEARRYFAEKGIATPKRCKSCHNAQKQIERGRAPQHIPSI
jgi:hypothetical protein